MIQKSFWSPFLAERGRRLQLQQGAVHAAGDESGQGAGGEAGGHHAAPGHGCGEGAPGGGAGGGLPQTQGGDGDSTVATLPGSF